MSISVGGVTLTSPNYLGWDVTGSEKRLSLRGAFYEANPATAHTKRNTFLNMVLGQSVVQITYTGDSSINGYYWLTNAQVQAVKLAVGLYAYSIEALYVGASYP